MQQNEKFYNLDYLRVAAAVCIVLHHYQQHFEVHFNGFNFYGGGIPFGYIVELFFMISGFLCVHTRKNGGLKGVVKKMLRIYPYALLADGFFIIEFLLYTGIRGDVGIFKYSYSVVDYICSIFLVHQGWVVERFPGINNPTWYLCVLVLLFIIFYLIEAIGNRFSRGSRIKIVFYSVFVGIGLLGWYMGWDAPFFHLTDFRGYAAFFIGCLLYYIISAVKNRKRTILIGVALLVMFFLVVIVRQCIEWYPCVLLGIPAILILCVSVRQIKNSVVELFGASSFEVYLWHVPLMHFFSLVAELCGFSYRHSVLSMIITLLLIELIATLIYYFCSRPLSRRLNKLIDTT